MAVDMFIKINGVKGESTDKQHKGETDVLAWSWGMSQSGSFHGGGGGGAGKVNIQDISLTKYIDKGSSNLMLFCCNGKHLADATLICRKAGEKALEYLTVIMTKVMITSVSTGGSGGEERLTENVTLNFAKVEVKYKEQEGDGSGSASQDFIWNIQENEKG